MANNTVVNWEAKEHIERSKDAGWYVGFFAVVIVLIAVAILLNYWLFIAVIVLATIALMIYVMRPPRVLHYSLTNKGLTEGNNLYTYDTFRSFGIIKEGNNYSIILMPKKRFGTRVTVFFPETEGEQIVDEFGARLPMEEVQPDVIDRLVRWLRI